MIRGRAAMPLRLRLVDTRQPNPAGRRNLTIQYRANAKWQSWSATPECVGGVTSAVTVVPGSPLDLAERAIIYYFRKIGGFSRADDAVIAAFYGLLHGGQDAPRENPAREDARAGQESVGRTFCSPPGSPTAMTPEELRMAIDAKAASLVPQRGERRVDKRIFTGRPETFARRADYWLEQSRERRERLDKQRRADADRAESAAAERRAQRERRQAMPRPELVAEARRICRELGGNVRPLVLPCGHKIFVPEAPGERETSPPPRCPECAEIARRMVLA